jgi:hypothetical protein
MADARCPVGQVDDLITQIRVLEQQAKAEFDRLSGGFSSDGEIRRIRFSQEVAALQRGKVGLFEFVSHASLLSLLVAPVIYSGAIPLLLLDLFLSTYQAICFRVYRIAKVKRSDYLVLDRGDLPYLNVLERFNCFYCGYANGLMAYGTEISARTEQYFCPIKHARRILAAHDHYQGFFEYGDAESYRLGLERLRDALAESPDPG